MSVAQFDGTAWQPLGDGLRTNGPFNNRPSVYALTIHNGELIAAGSFSHTGNTSIGNVARWDGSAWQSMGGGFTAFTFAPTVFALTVYNGELIAAGAFQYAGNTPVANIARWDGTAWQAVGTDLNNFVRALTVHNGELIAAGSFTMAGSTPANRIARWNGTIWQEMGNGFALKTVHSLASYRNELVAGGEFIASGATTISRIARWNGTEWLPLGTGMGTLTIASAMVQTLAVFDGELFAGGSFTTADGNEAKYIARWNGTNWSPLNGGLDGQFWPQVLAMAPFRGQLIVGGTFSCSSSGGAAFWTRWGCPCPPNRRMDLNWDCRIDADDFDLFSTCETGPGLYHDGTSTCMKADSDFDGDVDALDFAVFQRCITTNHQPMTSDCPE
jgi:hypothetical protein